jgi:hypothetical protein
MSRFSRIINVEDMRVTGVNDPNRSIAAGFTAKTFIYTGDEKQEVGKKPGAGKPGGAAGKAQALKSKSEAGMNQ